MAEGTEVREESWAEAHEPRSRRLKGCRPEGAWRRGGAATGESGSRRVGGGGPWAAAKPPEARSLGEWPPRDEGRIEEALEGRRLKEFREPERGQPAGGTAAGNVSGLP